MALKPEFSILGGIATGALVYGVYAASLPSVADTRSLQANNPDLAKSERVASWTSAGVVAGVSLIAKDPTIFIIGGTMVVAMAWMHRHANSVNPSTGTMASSMVPRVSQAEAPQNYAAPVTPKYDSVF
jgi:hypothetical protein